MNLYEIASLENQIEKIASENEGEVPEAAMQALVEAETQSLVQIENLCKYIRKLKLGIDMCRAEEDRIFEMRNRVEKRIKSIEKYVTPYIAKHGKLEAGTFTLSTQKSKKVIIDNADQIPGNYLEQIVDWTIKKNEIKKDLKAGIVVPGAHLEENDNLQIK